MPGKASAVGTSPPTDFIPYSASVFIDTHCHLDATEFDEDRDDVVTRAQQSGVTTLIVPSVERANFGAVASVCRSYACCRAAYGIHPLFTHRARPEDLIALRETLREQTATQSAIAIGEIGLDFFVEPCDRPLQEHFFVEQLKLAREFDLPVLLHVRRAIDSVLKHLRRHPVRGGIAHAFNGSHPQANEFIRLGFKLGFGGAMTHPRALRLRELATTLPLETIVLETDAPDIPPAWMPRQRNTPEQLPAIAAVLASLRTLPEQTVARITTQNARQVLNLPTLNLSDTP